MGGLNERPEKIEKPERKTSLADLTAIAERASRAVKRPYVSHGELLYDRDGLPKKALLFKSDDR